MEIAAGTKFNHYEISAKLGAGGMGEISRAEERLGREGGAPRWLNHCPELRERS